ncbi:MAG: glycosyltransferase family A protein [Spirochaetota bacterium]|nr:glycosyltransferase family A protein [Spirochaetota bacterium]
MINISVIIPVYNRTKELLRALDSVYNQTSIPEEVIIVDDCSDYDLSSDIDLSFYTGLNSNLIFIRNKKRLGAAESRNIGARIAKGKYLAFLDSDDYWDSHKLELQLKLALFNENIGLIYCDQWVIDSNGLNRPSGKQMINDNILDHLLKGWTAPNTSTLLIKKNIFQEIGGFDNTLASCQDHDLWMKIAITNVIVQYIPDRLSYFSTNSTNRISLNYENRLSGAKYFLDKWGNLITELKGTTYYKKFRKKYINIVLLPIILDLFIKEKRILKSINIFIKNLLFINANFYISLFNSIISKWTYNNKK